MYINSRLPPCFEYHPSFTTSTRMSCRIELMFCAVVKAASSIVFSSPLVGNFASVAGLSTSAEIDGAIIDRRTDEISARSPHINPRIGGRLKGSPLRQSEIPVSGFMTALIASFSSCTWSGLAGRTTEVEKMGAAEKQREKQIFGQSYCAPCPCWSVF